MGSTAFLQTSVSLEETRRLIGFIITQSKEEDAWLIFERGRTCCQSLQVASQ